MLVITRRRNESIVINHDIIVTVVEVRGDKVRLGVVAPKEVWVHRKEVYDAIHGRESVFPPTADHSSSITPAMLSWNNGIIPRLAQAAYDERTLPDGTVDNARLAVLADALEEAGCTDEQILTHLRDGGEHAPGCWVIDLLLGKR